jgi:hypothetical protein
MSKLNGIHAENRNVGELTAARNAIVGRDGCITILHGNAGAIYPQIRRDLGPDVLVHVRMYTPNWYALDAKRWAAECVGHLIDMPGMILNDPMVIITPANEQDLAAEGHPGAATEQHNNPTKEVYDYIWNWCADWTVEFRRLVPTSVVKIFTAPFAGGHEPAGYPPDYEYQLGSFLAYLHRCDGLSAHGYCNRNWTGHSPEKGGYWAAIRPLRPEGYRERDGTPKIRNLSDPGGLMTQYPEYPCLISEFGNWNHHDTSGAAVEATIEQYKAVYQAYSESGRCVGITPFIFDSGDEHRENRMRGNDSLIRMLGAMERYPAAGWNVTPAPKWYWPLAKVEVTQTFSATHKATDMRAPTGTPVYAVCDGDVRPGTGEKYGTFLLQSLPGGYYAVGAHLQVVTRVGAVKAGEQIAVADNTGTATTGAHLHFEIRDEQQNRYDPMEFLAGKGAVYPNAAPPVTDWEEKYRAVKSELEAAQARISAARSILEG